jgi:hypothetical protein
MKRLKWIILILSIPSIVNAGILIEPYVGYNLGLSQDTSLKDTSSQTFGYESKPGSSPGYGARLGYSVAMVFAAVDYSMSSFTVEDKYTTYNSIVLSNPDTYKTDVDQTALGVAVGITLPLFRFWGKYLFNVKWDMGQDKLLGSDGTDKPYKTELSGSGIALGAGFSMLPFIKLFLEYQSITVDDVDVFKDAEGTDLKGDITSYNRERSSILLGVSIPFDI